MVERFEERMKDIVAAYELYLWAQMDKGPEEAEPLIERALKRYDLTEARYFLGTLYHEQGIHNTPKTCLNLFIGTTRIPVAVAFDFAY